MPVEAAKLGDLGPTELAGAISRAAEALRRGELVVLPTETVYGVFASGVSERALADLAEACGVDRGAMGDGPPFVWHAPDGDEVRSRVDRPTPVARRLTRKFMPGPVRFVLEQTEGALAALRDGLGVGAGVIEAGRRVAVRVPDHAACAAALREAGVPVVALGIGSARWASRGAGRSVGVVPSSSDSPLPSVVLDDGPTEYGTPSTVIRLGLDGRFEVGSGGAIDEGAVLAALERTILFVCTGNTCRSPMAEAIARDLVSKGSYRGITTRVESAGVAAAAGLGASAQAAETMRRQGLDLREHRSRPLTPGMVRAAEVVFTMTPSHAEAVMTMSPEAASKVFPLDPRGVIEDPVGHPVAVYERTARRLRDLIEQRLQELDA